MITSTSFIVF